MKSLATLLLASLSLSFSTMAQIEIHLEGTTTDISGQTFSYYPSDTVYYYHDFRVYNNTGVKKEWFMTRVRINPPSSWYDYMCWGLPVSQENPFGGVCIDAAQMDVDDYTMPVSDTSHVPAGDYGQLTVYQKPFFDTPGTYTYRYYIGTPQNYYEDSIDVDVIITPLSIAQLSDQSAISMYPNPSSENVVVEAKGIQDAVIRIVDVHGKTVLENSFSSIATIETSSLKNGVYTVILTKTNGDQSTNRLVVRH